MGIKAGDGFDLLGPKHIFTSGIEDDVSNQIFVKLHETIGQTVLPLELNHVAVKGFVFLNVVTKSVHTAAPLVNGHGVANQRGDLRIENPVDHIVLIFEVIIKGIAADATLTGQLLH